ncbi:facilitated trehalose transporter Tret1-like isoform X2 [Photinus pyralis]|uniref:facilitated trehalose transporter Tret1-like isoform X2 n=1 Tax=Photinus pyralis TaxID=7054 RepID=UPI00126757E5|nr:facilitated trehalose transporter Tret1-like isoform X2 [Photinus pyralis]
MDIFKMREDPTQPLKKTGNKLPQYIAALSVCLGSVATGAVLGWTSNISEAMKAGAYNGIPIDDDNLGWIGSFATLGAMCMCFPIGILCDLIGRKVAMLILTVPFVIGWLLIIFANSVGMIYAGRFITGCAGGAFCVSAPLYTSEIAEKEIRGALGSYFQLLLTVGILFSYIIGFVADIKTYTIIVAILPLVFCVVFFFQPETPVYRMKQKREGDARAALIRLRGKEYDVDAELKEIRETLEAEEKNRVSFITCMKTRSAKIASIVCFSLMFFQQAGGINAVIFYTGDIFKSSGSSLDPGVATIICGVIQSISTFVSSLIIDKLGRRILLILSDLLMVVSGVALGIFFSLKERELVDKETLSTLGFLPIVSLSVFFIVFSLGFGPIPWMISSELFPSEIKSVASSAAGTFNWFIAFLITKFYLSLKNAVGGDVTFYIFSVISLIGTIFCVFVVPETKGKSLEEIQRELNKEK